MRGFLDAIARGRRVESDFAYVFCPVNLICELFIMNLIVDLLQERVTVARSGFPTVES